jgi:hypothetical protein
MTICSIGSLFSSSGKKSNGNKTKTSSLQEDVHNKFPFVKDHPKVLELIATHVDKLSDEALVKMLRQLEICTSCRFEYKVV